jgi:hypothetical protein
MKTMNKKNISIVLTNLVSFLAISFVLVSLSGCGDSGADPTPSAQDEIKEKLTANKWNLQTATVDGTDKTAVYKNLSITFAASSYSSTNGGGIWPATGTWSFNSVDGTSIKRDDGLIMALDVTDTILKLSFTWSKNTLGGGRIESVSGQHILTFGN